MNFVRPTQIDEALAILANGDWDVLSGGTDYFPALRDEPPTSPILDISGIESLKGVSHDADGWRIGGLTTWTELIQADLPPAFDALKLAAREVGSVQIQNRATIAGNLCNASPAADGVPPLLILDAVVELSSLRSKRVVPLETFILGNRETALSSDELVTAIIVPDIGAGGKSSFLKLGARKYLVISIAMVATRLSTEGDCVAEAAISVGACSAVATRLANLETALIGSPLSEVSTLVTPERLNKLSPISDVRASKFYRQVAAVELVKRACLLYTSPSPRDRG